MSYAQQKYFCSNVGNGYYLEGELSIYVHFMCFYCSHLGGALRQSLLSIEFFYPLRAMCMLSSTTKKGEIESAIMPLIVF